MKTISVKQNQANKLASVFMLIFMFFVSIHAQSVSVWTLDEQLSSNNLTVLRFRVQNTGQQTINGLELHYLAKQDFNNIAPAEAYYIPGANTEWVQQNNGEALLKISFPNVVLEPMEELSDISGFSVGLHTKDWTAWNKQEHYSQPRGNTFTLTDKVSVYSGGLLLSGTGSGAISDLACPEVWFLEIQKDSVKIGWLPSDSTEEQTTLELHSFNGTSQTIDLTQAADSNGYMEWSGAFPVQHENKGELWLNCLGKMSSYFAYGRTPEHALPAVEAELWDSEYAFVSANMKMGFNTGLTNGDRFIVEPRKFGHTVYDWKLYKPWEAPNLPELPKVIFPSFAEQILPENSNDSMTFAWTALEGIRLYQLNVVKDSIYGDTLISVLVSGTEIRVQMPPTGMYVWWAEPVQIVPLGNWLTDGLSYIGGGVVDGLTTVTGAVATGFDYLKDGIETIVDITADATIRNYPVLNMIFNDVSITEAIGQYFSSKSPLGTISIVAGGTVIHRETLGLTPIRGRKDTHLLDLGWAGDTTAMNNRYWDEPNVDTTGDYLNYLRPDERPRCWAISTQLMNHYFGGTLTQDEIVYRGKSPGYPVEEHFPHWMPGDGIEKGVRASGFPSIIPAMNFALNNSAWDYLSQQGLIDNIIRGFSDPKELFATAPGWSVLLPSPYEVISNIEAGIPMVIVQMNDGYSGMHIMVIDGYRLELDGSVYLHFQNLENTGKSGWRYYALIQGLSLDLFIGWSLEVIANLANLAFNIHLGGDFYLAYYVPPANAKGRLSDPDVDKDSDGDGVRDFDEKHRFGTDYNNPDTDGDGINDKNEIAYYTRLKKSADIDKDGLRAEMDFDSDGDGDCDGDENANKNNKKEPSETNMMDKSSVHPTRRNCKAQPAALVSREQLKMNDRALCSDGASYCLVVSLGVEGNAVQLGASAKVSSILSGSSVLLRSRALVYENVHAAGDLILQDATPQVIGSIKQNDRAALRLTQLYSPDLDDFGIKSESNTFETIWDNIFGKNKFINNKPIIINSGETISLKPGLHRQEITVSSGAVLKLQPGKYQIRNLTVLSGGKIELLGDDGIIIDIENSFRWNGSFLGGNIQEVASRLKIRALGKEDIFLNTSFGGSLVAPNAHVIVGQAEKRYAGQIYAKRITLHQGSTFLWIPYGGIYPKFANLNPEYNYAANY